MTKSPKPPPLEEGLRTALRALDRQVAREMQRSPAEREVHGVQKWEPHAKRVESVAALLLGEFSDGELQLDSLIIGSQAFAKALEIISEELGSEGLGELRRAYCLAAAEALERAGARIRAELDARPAVM